MSSLREPSLLSFRRIQGLIREEIINLKTYLDQFAVEGLRTLVLSYRKIEQSEYKAWSARYEAARNLIEGKKDKMEDLQEELEKNLTVIGATAIDDKLQDEVRRSL